MLAANGGNVADHTPAVLTRALCHADNCYWLPNVRFRGLPCKTNTVSNTAFRGYGGPQGMLAIETVIDAIARTLGLPRRYGAPPQLLRRRPQRRDAVRHAGRGQHHRGA